jgi:hypothetical protein
MSFFPFNSDRYATSRPYGVEAIFHRLRLDVASFAARRQAAPVAKPGGTTARSGAAVVSRTVSRFGGSRSPVGEFHTDDKLRGAPAEARPASDKVAYIIGLPSPAAKTTNTFAQTNQTCPFSDCAASSWRNVTCTHRARGRVRRSRREGANGLGKPQFAAIRRLGHHPGGVSRSCER